MLYRVHFILWYCFTYKLQTKETTQQVVIKIDNKDLLKCVQFEVWVYHAFGCESNWKQSQHAYIFSKVPVILLIFH